MPVLPQVTPYGQAVCKVGGQHSIRCPSINQPCIDGVGSVGHPDWAEMGTVFVGGIMVILKLKPTRTYTLQKPPIGFVAEFREIADRILWLGNCRALIGADAPCDGLIDAIA